MALLLAQLITVPAPNGAPTEAGPALRPALEVLGSLDDDGQALVQAFADGDGRNSGVHLLWRPPDGTFIPVK